MIKFELISSGDIILNYKVKWTNKTEISMHSSYTTFKFCLLPFSIKLKCPGVGYKRENRKWHNSWINIIFIEIPWWINKYSHLMWKKKKWIFFFAESRKPMCLCPFSIIVIIMTISNYLMRLGRMWRLLIEEDVIHRHDRRLGPRWIASSEICVILYIMRKRGSIIVLLFIQSYIFKFLTCLPPRRLSSKLWPISRNSFRI